VNDVLLSLVKSVAKDCAFIIRKAYVTVIFGSIHIGICTVYFCIFFHTCFFVIIVYWMCTDKGLQDEISRHCLQGELAYVLCSIFHWWIVELNFLSTSIPPYSKRVLTWTHGCLMTCIFCSFGFDVLMLVVECPFVELLERKGDC
jgi:hypothetical protein